MKYYINEEALRDIFSKKLEAYRKEAGIRFAEENRYTNPLEDLTEEDKEYLSKFYAGDLKFEELPDSFKAKAEMMVEEVKKIDSKIQEGVYSAHLFTEEELKNVLHFSEFELKEILNGKEEESISKP